MPTTKALNPIHADAISLSLFKQHLRLDLTASDDEDFLLVTYLYAAWAKAEKYCNRYFGERTLETTFTVPEPYQLPEGSGPATAVRGFITDVAQLPTVNQYWVEYVKGSIINRELPLDYWNAPTYTVTYTQTQDPEPDAVVAILKIAADLYENRENSVTGPANRPIALSAQALLNPYRVIS